MSLLTARVVDVHAHVVLEASMGAAGSLGPELGTAADGTPWVRIGDFRLAGVRYQGSPFMDVDLRLERMADAGIDYQLLSPNPLTYFHFVETAEAISFCRAHNDALAEIVRSHPGQLGGLAALPVQDPRAAVAELERAVTELDLFGAAIGAELPFLLDGQELDPLYEAFCSLDVPLFIHPAPSGIDGPAGDPRLQGFDLEVILGFAGQEALAITRLILGGVLERHRELDVCVSHGGGSMAMLAERIGAATRQRPWAPEFLRADGAFEAMLARIWVDNHIHQPQLEPQLAALFGAEHVVFGTNFAGWDQPASAGHGQQLDPLLADNARRLLRAERAA